MLQRPLLLLPFLQVPLSSQTMPSLPATTTASTPDAPLPTRHRQSHVHTSKPHLSRRRLGRRLPLLSDTRPPLLASPSPDTLRYYGSLASRLALSGRLRDFLMLAESALGPGGSPSQFISRVNTHRVAQGVREVLRAGGNLRLVMEFLGGAEALGISAATLLDDLGVEALAAECWSLLQAGRIEEFVEVIETLSGYQLQIKNVINPMDILKIFIKKRDPFMAVRFASLYSHSQLLFCSIIEEFGKKKDLVSVLKAFDALKNKSGAFNMFTYRSMVDLCGLCGDPLKSRDIFEELLSQKIIPNTFVFNSLMNVNAYDLNYTLYVYKHMQSLGVPADIRSYNILLKACCLANRVDLVQDIYKELKLMKSSTALRLDVVTYSTMIKAYADAKLLRMALEIKEDMVVAGVEPNIVTWTSLIAAWAKAGLIDRAIHVFEEMLLAGCEPNTRCCNTLLYACIKAYQYDKAFRLFNTWKAYGFRVYSGFDGKVIGSRSSHGDLVTESLPTSVAHSASDKDGVVKIVPFKPTIATYNLLMKACGEDYYRAKHLINEMKSMGLSPNLISWSTLIGICGSTQNVKGAMQALKEMQDDGVQPHIIAYTAAIKACAGSKDLEIAFFLFEEMKRHKLQPNLATYNTLLRARKKNGSLNEVRQCLAIYQDMRKAGFNSNDDYLKELIDEWCEGVLSSECEKQDPSGLYSSDEENIINNSQNFLEKVADYLQKDNGISRPINVRGLSKVEARIVVLSVLRMIKEGHRLGRAVKDDLVIIAGISKDELEVQQAIASILRDNLGLDVLTANGPSRIGAANVGAAPAPVSSNNVALSKPNLSNMSLARRPDDLGIIRVSGVSLSNWLQKKSKDSFLQKNKGYTVLR